MVDVHKLCLRLAERAQISAAFLSEESGRDAIASTIEPTFTKLVEGLQGLSDSLIGMHTSDKKKQDAYAKARAVLTEIEKESS